MSSRFKKFLIVAVVLSLTMLGSQLSMFSVTLVHAATWSVNTIADDNNQQSACPSVCSLRDAILAASSGDTVVFDISLSGKTVYLKNGSLAISKSITIGGNNITVNIDSSGNNGEPAFVLSSAPPLTPTTVQINHLTFLNGNAIQGSAIDITGSNNIVNLNSVEMQFSYAQQGGAIYNALGNTVTIQSGMLAYNSALQGGAIYNAGTMTITGPQVAITNNEALNFGGAIENLGQLTVSSATIANNKTYSTSSTYSYGGAIDVGGEGSAAATLNIASSTFDSNSAIWGGAIYVQSIAKDNGFNISATTFSRNTATYVGGALFLSDYYGTLLADTFTGNSAGAAGGAIENQSSRTASGQNSYTLIVSNSYMAAIQNDTNNSSSTGNTSLVGAAIDSTAGKLYLSNDNIGSNLTTSCNTASTIQKEDANIQNDAANMIIIQSTIANNVGVGISNGGGGIISVQDTTIAGNHTTATGCVTGQATEGGGIHAGAGQIYLANTTLANNPTLNDGSQNIGGESLTVDDATALVTLINTILVTDGRTHNCLVSAGSVQDDGARSGGLFDNLQWPDGSCPSFLYNQNPLIGGLAQQGGWTWTMSVDPAGAAVKNGNPFYCVAFNNNSDGRGWKRSSTSYCDIGAYDTSAVQQQVNSILDQANGSCTPICTLRDAIANATPNTPITFVPGLGAQGPIQLTLGELVIPIGQWREIDGPSTGPGIVLDGGHQSRIFYVPTGAGTGLGLSYLTLQNGMATSEAGNCQNNGGAICVDNAVFSVSNSTFYNNAAPSGCGGALGLSLGGSTYIDTIINSTFYQNSASCGSAIRFTPGGPYVVNSTFSHNQGGDTLDGGRFSLANDVLANNSQNCASTMINSGGNIEYPQSTCISGGQPAGTNPLVDGNGLVYNSSWSTGVLPIVAGGPAASSGSLSYCETLLGTGNPNCKIDQRGYQRLSSPYSSGSYTAAFVGQPHVDTIGLYRQSNSTFYLATTDSPLSYYPLTAGFGAGMTTPLAIAGDWNGSGVDGVGLFDQANGQWRLCNAGDSCATPAAADKTFVYGVGGDVPLAGHWEGSDPTYGVGVWRQSAGFILATSISNGNPTATYTEVLGIPGDQVLVGDWNGDGIDSPGVYRPSNATFYLTDTICNCSVTGATHQFQFGVANTSYVPLAGDWAYPTTPQQDGVGLYLPSTSVFYLKNQLTTGTADYQITFGATNDQPIAGHWSGDAPPKPPPSSVLVPSTPVPVAPGSGNGSPGLGD